MFRDFRETDRFCLCFNSLLLSRLISVKETIFTSCQSLRLYWRVVYAIEPPWTFPNFKIVYRITFSQSLFLYEYIYLYVCCAFETCLLQLSLSPNCLPYKIDYAGFESGSFSECFVLVCYYSLWKIFSQNFFISRWPLCVVSPNVLTSMSLLLLVFLFVFCVKSVASVWETKCMLISGPGLDDVEMLLLLLCSLFAFNVVNCNKW